MRRILLGLSFVLLTAIPAAAGFSEMGVGTTSCATFGQQYLKNANVAELAYFSWAQGYMSGLNEMLMRRGAATKNLETVPLARQKALLRGYCASHPDSVFRTAVLAMFLSMRDNPPPARRN